MSRKVSYDNDDADYRGAFDELCAEFDWPDSLWSDLDAACGGTLSNVDKIGLLLVITE